jgi:hypothetical protein
MRNVLHLRGSISWSMEDTNALVGSHLRMNGTSGSSVYGGIAKTDGSEVSGATDIQIANLRKDRAARSEIRRRDSS